MRVLELEFHDKDGDWQLAPTEFFPDLTLLVGISGVGKTRILRAVSALRDITEGNDDELFWGVQWNTRFATDDGTEYRWNGSFEERESLGEVSDFGDGSTFFWPPDKATKPRPRILEEYLTRNSQPIVERDNGVIRLDGKPMPKLSPYESAVKILSEEDAVSSVHGGFKQLLSVNHSDDPPGYAHVQNFERLCQDLDTLEKIRNSDYSTKIKLGLVHENDRKTFDQIRDRFVEVFPQVQEVEVARIKLFPGELLQIRIKEHGVGKWIPEHKISSGMSRTLLHLSRMILWPDGMVVLIDDFENSLGVNCIDFLTKDLVDESSRVQFLITSHHPYIINNIDTRHWKIVVRDGSIVSARNATEFGLEESCHEAFIKLMNLPLYQEGIAVE
jgi:hypothetical protein